MTFSLLNKIYQLHSLYKSEQWLSAFSNVGTINDYFHLQAQTGSGPHLASYPMITGGSVPRGEADHTSI